MIGLDCLRHAPELIGALQKKVEAIMHGMLADGKPIPFMEVYKELIKSLEIGIEDASKVYLAAANAVKVEYSDKIDDALTTQDDLDKLVRGDVDKLLNEIGKKRDPKTGSIRYQRENVATNLARAIIGLINNKEYPVPHSDTIAAQVRKNVLAYAKSILKDVKEGSTPTNLLKEVIEKQLLDPSATSFGTVGQEALWDALKPSLDSIVEQIKDPAVKEKFRNEIRKIKEAAFNLGITQTKRQQILYDLIVKEDKYTTRVGAKKLAAERDLKLFEEPGKRKEIEDWYAKEYEKLKKVPNWNAIAKAGDMEEVLDKVLGEELAKPIYGAVNASTKKKIYNALISQYNQLKSAATLQRAMQLNKQHRAQLIDEVAMQNGFFRWAGSKRVPDYSAKGDRQWLKYSLLQAGFPNEAKGITDKTGAKDINKYISDVVGKWIDNKDFSQVAEATRRLMLLNNKPFEDKARKIDRIGRYREAGIGLDHITDGIAANVLGLRIKPEYMAELAAIADMRNELEQTPNKLYDRMKLDPKLRDRLPQQYNMSRFARIAYEELNRRTSRLIARTIRNDDWTSLAGIIEGFKKWKRMILTAILTNPVNVPQNLFYNQFQLIRSLPKFTPKALYELEKEYFSNLWSVIMGDPLGSEESIRKSEDISSIYHYDSPIWKIYGAIKQYSEGLITGLDAAAQTIIDRNRMFETITREIGLKANAKEYKKILDEYRYLNSSHVATELAKQYLKSVGITDARRPKAYQRILAREARNIEFGFFMGERFGEYINADRIHTYSNAQKKVTRQTLGREDQSTFSTAGGILREDVKWNPFSSLNKYLDKVEERAQEDYLKARNSGKGVGKAQAQWGLAALANNTLSTGLIPFAAGAYRFIVIGGQSLGFGYSRGSAKENKAELERLIKIKSPDRVSYNENLIKATLHNYEMDRFRTFLAISGVMGLFTFASLMLATSDDDDGDEWYEKITNQTYDVMQGHPYMRAFLTRVAPAWTRAIAGFAEADKKVKMGKPLTTAEKAVEGLSNVVGMRTPLTPTAVFEKFKRHPRAEIGRTLSTQFGVGNLFWPISFYNTVEDEIRGFRKQTSIDSNPFIRELTDDEWINGMFWGIAGYGPSYAVEGRNVPNTELNLIGENWPKEISYGEMLSDVKGKEFNEVPWAKYGRRDLQDRKKEIQRAYNLLPNIKERIYDLSREIGDGFMYKSDLDAVWERPTRGFMVDIINGDIDDVERRLKVQRSSTGRINMLDAARIKMRLNDLTVTDITNAIQFKNLQEKQLPQ